MPHTQLRLRDYGLLSLVCLLFFLPGFFTLPVMDRDEARFAQASKQMLETGDFIDIRFQEDPRHKKPVGIYWLQTMATSVFGGVEAPIWAYRIPSLLGAMIGVIGTAWAANTFLNRRSAVIAGAVLASCLLLTVEARLAKTDAMLLATSTVAMGALAHLWMRTQTVWTILLFWVTLACGVLIKGPIIFLPVVCAVVALSLSQRSGLWFVRYRAHLGGVLLFCLIVLPWFILISLKTEGAFFHEALGTDLSKKIISAQESHGAPPGVYLLSSLGTFWPWMPFLLISLAILWKQRRQNVVVFCAAWAIPAWIILEFIPTKLPHYVLPLFPALAIMVAFCFERIRWQHWLAKLLFAVVALILSGAMIGVPLYLQETPDSISIIMALAVLITILVSLVRGIKPFTPFIAAWLVYTGVIAGTLSHIQKPFVSVALADTVQDCRIDKPFAIAGYHEPSLVFLTQTDTRFIVPEEADALMQAGTVELVFLPSHLPKPAATFPVANVTGLNYNGGDPVDLTGYAKNPELCLTSE